jgi:hypothetical protein
MYRIRSSEPSQLETKPNRWRTTITSPTPPITVSSLNGTPTVEEDCDGQ